VKKEQEPFDPRIIVYVSLPALVLGAQLFFTFSRDALSAALPWSSTAPSCTSRPDE